MEAREPAVAWATDTIIEESQAVAEAKEQSMMPIVTYGKSRVGVVPSTQHELLETTPTHHIVVDALFTCLGCFGLATSVPHPFVDGLHRAQYTCVSLGCVRYILQRS